MSIGHHISRAWTSALYNSGIRLYRGCVDLAATRPGKARLMHRGHRHVWQYLDDHIEKGARYVWVHTSSLGEFEQGRPLMERIRRERPDLRILLTFFSPSGYEVRQNWPGADAVCYLPFDLPGFAERFLDKVKPVAAIFVKYEFWRNYLFGLERRGVPTFLVSGIFRPGQVFGWEDTMPRFAHLPLLLKPVGNGKLSKRDGDKLGFPVFPLEWTDPKSGEKSSGYREQGYLPEAVVNFLALLGWNPGDDSELMTMDELTDKFSLEHCSKAGAKFDYKKGVWFNHEYLMRKPNAELAELFVPQLREHGVEADPEYVAKAMSLVKGRASLLPDLWKEADFFFVAPSEYAPKDVKKRWKEGMADIMEELLTVLEGIGDMTSANAEKIVLDWIAEKGYHLGNVMNAFRLCVVGACRGPHMFDITEIMPRAEVAARVRRAIDALGR